MRQLELTQLYADHYRYDSDDRSGPEAQEKDPQEAPQEGDDGDHGGGSFVV